MTRDERKTLYEMGYTTIHKTEVRDVIDYINAIGELKRFLIWSDRRKREDETLR